MLVGEVDKSLFILEKDEDKIMNEFEKTIRRVEQATTIKLPTHHRKRHQEIIDGLKREYTNYQGDPNKVHIKLETGFLILGSLHTTSCLSFLPYRD